MSFEEKRPFLGQDTDSESDSRSSSSTCDGTLNICRTQKPCRRSHRIFYPIVSGTIFSIATIFLLANIGLFVHLVRRETNTVTSPYTPAEHAISHTLQEVHEYNDDDPFIGPPSPAFDKAWSDLLSPFNIRVSASEMRKANQQSLRLEDDQPQTESYLGYLEVYHQLHCIKLMVQIRHPDHYPGLISTGMLTEQHFGHCIQALQHTIMCHADASLSTWMWDGNDTIRDEPRPLTTKSKHVVGATGSKRQCVDWTRLDAWARERSLGWNYELKPPGTEGWFGPKLDEE